MKITSATLTAVTPDGYPVEIPVMLDEGEKITEAIGKLAGVLSKAGWEPPISANSQEGEVDSFPAMQLSATVDKGNVFWQVQGGSFQKFGVRIWPEVLAEAGFSVEELNPVKAVNLQGYTAHYVKKANGKPKKVIRLVPEA